MKNEIQTRTVVVDAAEIWFTLEWKDVRNLNLRVRKDGSVYVSVNPTVTEDEVDAFVANKSGFILNAKKKFQEALQYRPQPKQYVSGESFTVLGHGLRLEVIPSERDSISSDGVFLRLYIKNPDDFEKKQRMVRNFLNKQCRLVFSEILNDTYPVFEKYGVEMPVLRIRDMETRWGSCLVKKRIVTLNRRLLEAPRHCIEYVVMHEMCHFIHPNHSKHFYAFLTMLMPDWKERKQVLDKSAEYWL